jgi:uncharacterized protein (DUF885 family)
MRIPRVTLLAPFALLALAACHDARPRTPSPPGAVADGSLEGRRKALRALIDEQWEYNLRTSPEFATSLGDKRYNDRWSDPSDAFARADVEVSRQYVARLEAIDPAGFPEQERLNHALLLRQQRLVVEGARFEGWLMPVNQFWGPHIGVASLVTRVPTETVKDYDDYLARLRALPAFLDGVAAAMRLGLTKGLMPPKILLGKVAQQAQNIAETAPEASPFAAVLKRLPAAFPEAERARIRGAVLGAIRDQVAPAYTRFAGYVRAEYEPRGRQNEGEWSLPLGADRYAFDVRQTTSTPLAPEAIHELGLREVARIEAEMLRVAKKLGYGDLAALGAAIAKSPALHFASRAAVLDLYRAYTEGMTAKLPSLFGRLPRAKLEVLPVEEFREKEVAGAEYNQGTPDGSRPGQVKVSLADFASRTNLTAETTTYHEGVPGHHLQISIAQEIEGLPPFRQQYFVTAYVEGWALYAERLGEEVGFYKDPYSYYGHLQDEMLRAIRLVVDTGLHAKRWTRQQVVDFFHAHSTSDEAEVQAETDRYIAIPSQALAYKIGQLKILELREKAKRALGDRFDLRGFHDTVLGSGALPLDVLEQQVDAWIASRRGA